MIRKRICLRAQSTSVSLGFEGVALKIHSLLEENLGCTNAETCRHTGPVLLHAV